jgi:hypothetical protein
MKALLALPLALAALEGAAPSTSAAERRKEGRKGEKERRRGKSGTKEDKEGEGRHVKEERNIPQLTPFPPCDS